MTYYYLMNLSICTQRKSNLEFNFALEQLLPFLLNRKKRNQHS